MLKILPGLYRQKCGGKGGGKVQVGSESQILILASISQGVFLAQGSPYCLRGLFWFPSGNAMP